MNVRYSIHGIPNDMVTSEFIGKRRFKVSGDSQKTAFGQLVTAQDTPLVQITAQYGLLSGVSTVALGGTTTTENSKFIANSGASSTGVSAIISSRQVKHRVGQGLKGMFTAIFSTGQTGSFQQAGLISSDVSFAFGYDDQSFGVLYAKDGQLEIQNLAITTPASGESATVTVDGVAYTIPLSSGTIDLNAYEVAAYLTLNEPRYDATSNGGIVTLRARLPDFGGGAFAFSSSNAIASWSQIVAAALPVEIWTPQTSWNIESKLEFNPALLNIYMIQFESLAGSVKFYMQDPVTSDMTLVHVIRYTNTSTLPIVPEAVYRVGWANRNRGNTTNTITQGTSAAIMIEGEIALNTAPSADSFLQSSIGTQSTNVLSLRNRTVFNTKSNRTDIYPQKAFLFTESAKTAIFDIIIDATVPSGDLLAWDYYDNALSTAEVAKNSVLITGGTTVASIAVSPSSPREVDLRDIINELPSFSSLTICARLAANGSASDMGVSFNWIEDK